MSLRLQKSCDWLATLSHTARWQCLIPSTRAFSLCLHRYPRMCIYIYMCVCVCWVLVFFCVCRSVRLTCAKCRACPSLWRHRNSLKPLDTGRSLSSPKRPHHCPVGSESFLVACHLNMRLARAHRNSRDFRRNILNMQAALDTPRPH